MNRRNLIRGVLCAWALKLMPALPERRVLELEVAAYDRGTDFDIWVLKTWHRKIREELDRLYMEEERKVLYGDSQISEPVGIIKAEI